MGSPDDELLHYGVKGMRWGIRKKSDDAGGESSTTEQRKGLSDGQKKAIKYAAVGAALVGTVAVTAVLAKNGKLPVSTLNRERALQRSSDRAIRKTFLKDGPQAAAAKRATVEAARQARAQERLLSEVSRRQGESTMSKAKAAASTAKEAAQTVQRGKEVLDQMREHEMFRKQIDDFRRELADAHQQQTRAGINDAADAGIPYDASRDNPYSPEARRR